MPRPIHFEIHADDPVRAQSFYGKVLGWSFQKAGVGPTDYWLVITGPKSEPGIDGGMIRRMGPRPATGQPVNAYVCTVGVADLDAVLAVAAASGATMALPKMPVTGIGWLAYLHDPEGNILGLMQEDPSAR